MSAFSPPDQPKTGIEISSPIFCLAIFARVKSSARQHPVERVARVIEGRNRAEYVLANQYTVAHGRRPVDSAIHRLEVEARMHLSAGGHLGEAVVVNARLGREHITGIGPV